MTQRSLSISYAKGCAIIGVVLIHLIDWCEIQWSNNFLLFKELLYPFVLIFLATAGSLLVIASKKYDFFVASKRLVKRGLEIFFIYFLYSGIKLLIYNFDKQPFFNQFRTSGTLTFLNILTFKAYNVPITILLTIAFFVVISPLVLLVIRHTKYPKLFLSLLILVLLLVNYLLPHPQNNFFDFIYARGNITFPIMLWAVPFLLGMLLAQYDFEKSKYIILIISGVLTGVTYFFWGQFGRHEWRPSAAMYPLHPYYISFSFFFMYGLMIVFSCLEKIKSRVVRYFLAIVQLLGDHTLEIYIAHWLLIDMVSWLLYPHMYWLWVVMPVFLIFFLIWKRKNISCYFLSF